jgi:O-antigen/teichoic acid export membrane protein
MDTLKQDSIRGIRWTGSSQVITGALQFAQIAVLAHWLTPTDFGLMATILLALQFISTFADAGVSMGIIQAKELSDTQRSTLYWLHNGIAFIAAILLYVIAPWISTALAEPSLSFLLQISAVMIPITAMSTQFKVILHRNLDFKLVAIQEIVSMALYLVISLGMALLGYGVWSLLVGYIIAHGLGHAWIFIAGIRSWHPKAVFDITGLRSVLRFGFFHSGEKIILFLSTKADQLIVTSLLGIHALGIYNMALNLVIYPIQRINQAVSQVTFPLFARQQEDAQALRNGYMNVVKTVTLINAPLMAGIMVTAPLFIPLLIGPQWTESIMLTQVLAMYAYQRSTGAPSGSLLMAVGRTDMSFGWNIFALLVTLPVVYMGASAYGMSGLAWSFVSLHLFLGVVFYWKVIRPIIGPVGADYLMTLFKPLMYASMMGFLVRLFDRLVVLDPALELGLLVIVGITSYCALLYLLEKDLVNRLLTILIPSRRAE